MREKLFGRQYIRTAHRISSTASVMHTKGKFQEALSMYKEVLQVIKRLEEVMIFAR